MLIQVRCAVLILESKLVGKPLQFDRIDEAICAVQFIRNKSLRYWMDNTNVSKWDLSKFTILVASEFEWAKKLNSDARRASAERAWVAISKFYANCKAKTPGKKGYPQFQKDNRSVEYRVSGWKLDADRKHIKFTDGFEIGRLKLLGTRDLNFYQISQIKRVRIVKRADGYFVQFVVDSERSEALPPTGNAVGLDMGLNHFYTDSNGDTEPSPRFLPKSERKIKRLQKRVSRKVKGSANRRKAVRRLARKHLKVSRQRKDHAIKLARCVAQSNDLVAVENLQVKNMVKNHCLAKSISDASWSMFRSWLEYFAKVFGREVIAVSPAYTSQECSRCKSIVQKALSTRTHVCSCGLVLDRDWNAAINILMKATRGHRESWGESPERLGKVCRYMRTESCK